MHVLYLVTGQWTEAKGFLRIPEAVNEVRVRLTGRGQTDVTVDDVSLRLEKIEFPQRPPVQGWANERVRETLGRGAVAMRTDDGVYLSWRLLAEDPESIAFDVYRRDGEGPAVKVNDQPVIQTTDFLDTSVTRTDSQPT